MVASSSNFYQVGASLPVDAESYVERQADKELYQKLRSGKFCYVLNSRQMGKSSLRVRTMQRLKFDGTICAAIDLTGMGKHGVTASKWYAGIVSALVDSCNLEDKFDWETWLQKKQEILDPVMCLRLFIEQVLLEKIQQPIVIFVDEIDTVLSQNFSLDDFFALIRFFQNQRVDNPIFKRLTFALLGVATPNDLITDKTQTPFNIGEGIELHGFSLGEVKPLINGLQQSKVSNPDQVMEEILDWTGGQPFLTQKLCQFIVEESEEKNSRTVEQVVRSRIIENWESQDEPEHLRTIRDRILRDEQRASYLLELYQQIRQTDEQSKITADNTQEQSELQLSGLVVKQQNKLRVHNRIYKEIFDTNWVENQLKNLRPYSESFKIWKNSGFTDKSSLLRGKRLQGSLEWAKDKKNLSNLDREYLAASKREEIQRGIIWAFVLLFVSVLGALTVGLWTNDRLEKANRKLKQADVELKQAKQKTKEVQKSEQDAEKSALKALQQASDSKRKNEETEQEVKAVQQLNKLAVELKNQNVSSSDFDYNEALRLSALSFNINDHSLKQALVFVAQSQAYQQLKKLEKAKQEIDESKKFFGAADEKKRNSSYGLQIQLVIQINQGSLSVQKKETQKAIESYTTAFNILNNHLDKNNFPKDHQLITTEELEFFEEALLELLPKNSTKEELRNQVQESLGKYLYTPLKHSLNSKKWEQADYQTFQLILHLAKRTKQKFLLPDSINSLSCPDLQRINQLWVDSDKRFGFSVQKKIWIKIGMRIGVKEKDWTRKDHDTYLQFLKASGWYLHKKTNDNETVGSRSELATTYEDLMNIIKDNPSQKGTLPTFLMGGIQIGSHSRRIWETIPTDSFFVLRLVKCSI